MKKILCILLCLAMLTAVFAGCGGTAAAPVASDSAPAEAAPAEAAAPAEEAAPAEAAAPAEEAASAEEPVSAAEEVPAEEPAVTVQYPIFDEPTTLSIYWMFHNFLGMFGVTQQVMEQIPTFDQWQEATNVNLDFTLIGEETYGTTISLIWAAGDYYDFFCNGEQNYAAGADAAVDEGVLLDLAPYLEEHAPDYNAILNRFPDFRTDLTSSEGYILSFSEYCEYSDNGVAIRKDWLDQVGMEVPATMDDVWDVAVAWKDELGIRNPVMWNADLSSFFGWNAFGVAGPGRNDVAWQIDEDGKTVVCSMNLPGYKECLQWMHDAFAEGLVTDDFMNVMNIAFDEYIYANETGMVSTNSNLLAGGGAERSGQPSYDLRAIPDPMKEKGMENTLAKTSGGVGASAIAVSAQTNYPEECVEFMNWLYTPDGILVSCFGVEGETFYYDEEGVPHYTDVILNDPNMPSFVAAFLHTSLVGTPYFNTTERKMASYTTEAELECIDIWKTGRTGTNAIQGKNTSEESMEYNQIAGDIGTAAAEQSLRFVTGERSLDEYDAFMADLERMGLGRLQELRQAAYDRYLEAQE